MTLHIVYVIYSNNAARCISLFQGSQGEILGFAKPITFYVPFSSKPLRNVLDFRKESGSWGLIFLVKSNFHCFCIQIYLNSVLMMKYAIKFS